MVQTQEPRIRFLKNDTVVAEMWELSNGKLGFYNPESDDYFTLGGGAVDFTDLNLSNVGDIDAAGSTVTVDTLNANELIGSLATNLDAQNNDITNVGTLEAQSVNAVKETRTGDSPILIGSDGRREDFDGSDADTRLDNALAVANEGDTVLLENTTYTQDRSIGVRLKIVGSGSSFNGSSIDSGVMWTLTGFVHIYNITGSGTLVLDGTRAAVVSPSIIDITVKSVDNRIIGGEDVAVTFESGTSGNIVDSQRGGSVTDNGSNTVGDIS